MTDLPFCRFLQIRRKYKPKFQCFIFNIHWPRLTKQVCQKELKGFKWKGFEAAQLFQCIMVFLMKLHTIEEMCQRNLT